MTQAQDTVIADQLNITKVVRIHMAECARFRQLLEGALEENNNAVATNHSTEPIPEQAASIPVVNQNNAKE